MAEQSTIAVYPLDGTNRKFVVPYEYLARRFVTVTLLGDTRTELTLGTGFRFITANQIETTQAWGSGDGYTNIEIRRETSATQRLVDFYDGSVLRSRDLNVSAIQTIHIAEEARNMAGETLAENNDGNLDARFRKIVNVALATEPTDAINLGQVQGWTTSAITEANRSRDEANRSTAQAVISTGAATRSLASEGKALASEGKALASENAALVSEGKALASENAASVSENAAKASQLAAKTSETNSKTSENAAKASQLAAKTSETNSKTSETNSKTSETTANSHRLASLSSANASSSSASDSDASAGRSEASAVRSEGARDTILAIELTAQGNAAAALASQNAAKGSQAASKTSETNSKTSENAAKASELKAKAWAESDVVVDGTSHSAKYWADQAEGVVDGTLYMRKTANLSDLTDPAAARANLELHVSATRWPTHAEVTGKPTAYPTTWAEITGAPAYATRWPAWNEVTGTAATGLTALGINDIDFAKLKLLLAQVTMSGTTVSFGANVSAEDVQIRKTT